MVRFTLFGIPVTIEPLFWLTTFLLGGGTGLTSAESSRSALVWILVWMLVACFSILVHEFGHALTARKLSGGRNWIRLWALGGLAYHDQARPTRKERLWTIFMGPGAGLLLFLITCLVIIAVYGPTNGLGFIKINLTGEYLLSPPIYDIAISPAGKLFKNFIWINFWWSLINMLPVFPLDGGQFFSEWTGKRQLAHKVGAFTGGLVALIAFLLFQKWYLALMFGFLAYNNYNQANYKN